MSNLIQDHMKGLLGESEKSAKKHDWKKGKDFCLGCHSEWGKTWQSCQRCGFTRHARH